eukprot:CAMPEP_0174326846 /NCGR_PEP_ID=MMETSP0810-20121108/14156_1 /TAXON_ID=73025 ORGANISM="Eutreptiella gymnastica-like, Strain CCMP1594" /NCGR_SAMPLE_ID=MMETSP0810 /ASSEMBLY_ACC=CAM_ASM_000659 /LENGTH=57 /DNA_ID=CAMNT_0015440563 /DNA_START=790 /DNA_END=963 /DNA_ORIENTATION=-
MCFGSKNEWSMETKWFTRQIIPINNNSSSSTIAIVIVSSSSSGSGSSIMVYLAIEQY